MIGEELVVARLVGDAFDALGVEWLVGGSVASSLHGEPRSTNDVDMVAALSLAHVQPLVDALDPRFYIDADMVRDAVRRRASFNVIHLATMTKVDVFVPRHRALRELPRAVEISVQGLSLRVSAPEDIVIEKLIWFEKGARVSERQWRDVLGVLRIWSTRLDLAALQREAAAEGLSELLAQALAEARVPTP